MQFDNRSDMNSAAAVKQDGIEVKARSFISMTAVLIAVLIGAGMLTRMLPIGEYQRVQSGESAGAIIPGSYTVIEDAERLPVARWFTAPLELLASSDGIAVITVIVFLLIVGGSFLVLDRCGVVRHMLWTLRRRFANRRYSFMALMVFICMLLGSVAGLLEETVVLVPVAAGLAVAFGWDTLTGLGMSILAVNAGFTVGLFNPFNLVSAQTAAGLPAYSGLWLRLTAFAATYIVLTGSLMIYAKIIEKKPTFSSVYKQDKQVEQKYLYDVVYNPLDDHSKLDRAMKVFLWFLAPIAAYITASLFGLVPADYIIPVMALCIMFGGIIAGTIARYEPVSVPRDFLTGMAKILPAAIPIILAMSVKLIIENGRVLDSVLYEINRFAADYDPYMMAFAALAVVFVLEFFMSSASAKAALVIPLLLPLTDLAGVGRQTTVLAFLFGDGFPNLLMPTNACLLICLSLVGVSYGKWIRWSLPVQLLFMGVAVGMCALAVKVGYGL